MPHQNDAMKKQPNWNNVHSEYREWMDKISLVPNKFVRIVLLVSGASLVLLRDSDHKWYFTALLVLFGIFLISALRREGHESGYVDGCRAGYDEGRDNALGIDEEMRHFMDQVEMDKEIEKHIQKLK